MRFNLDTNNLANVLDRSTSVGKVTYYQLTLLENNESNNIVVFLTIQYYCLPLRHE